MMELLSIFWIEKLNLDPFLLCQIDLKAYDISKFAHFLVSLSDLCFTGGPKHILDPGKAFSTSLNKT